MKEGTEWIQSRETGNSFGSSKIANRALKPFCSFETEYHFYKKKQNLETHSIKLWEIPYICDKSTARGNELI